MSSERRQTPARIVRWLDRWRYLGAIAPSTVLLLIGARGPKPSLLETPAGFAQYMVLVAAFGLGAAVTRPLHSYLQHRYRPWQAAGSFGYRRRFYGGLSMLAVAAGAVVWAAVMALALWGKANGVWPWIT